MRKNNNKNTDKKLKAIQISRRRTLNLCFIGGIMCYLLTIFADYFIELTGEYLNSTEVFCVKLTIGFLGTWIGLKQIEYMDLSNESTFIPQ